MMQLIPMTQPEFDRWRAQSIHDYADDKIRSGEWLPADAVARSEAEHSQLLPDGLASENQYLYSLLDETVGKKVGMIWVAANHRGRPRAFIFDIVVDADQRGRGYGKQAMLALEDVMRAMGQESIGLHVFGHNAIARDLYLKVGYEVTDLTMVKKLT